MAVYLSLAAIVITVAMGMIIVFSAPRTSKSKSAHVKDEYETHRNISYYGSHYISLREEVFINYDTWLTLFNADPAHWEEYKEYASGSLPVYKNSDKFFVVKFLTKRDYKKYKDFLAKLAETGLDYENTQDLIRLTEAVKEGNQERLRVIHEETQELYNKIMKSPAFPEGTSTDDKCGRSYATGHPTERK